MKRTKLATITATGVLGVLALAGCSSSSTPTTAPPAASAASTAASPAPGAASAAVGVVLPVTANPIVNTSTNDVLTVTYAAVEDNVDPATGQAIDDRLQLTLSNSGSTPLTGVEVYYEMTDVVTGAQEAYYQPLDGLTVPAGGEVTVYFDNQTGAGHYPENQFSLYRSSANEVDFAIQVSAPDAQIATATAVKATGTGEKVD